MNILIGILAAIGVVILFGLAVFVHELGHFIAARLLGFRVEAFSIGFGKAIWKKKCGDTEYRISVIPFGGYVSLPQLDPSGMDSIQGARAGETPVPPMPPWKRIVAALAGPLGNMLLALLLAWLIYFFPGESGKAQRPTVTDFAPNSPALAAGMQSGDIITSLNGKHTDSWNEFLVEVYLVATTNEPLAVAVDRGGTNLVFNVTPTIDENTGRAIIGVVYDSSALAVPQWMQYRLPGEQLRGDAASIARVLKALFVPSQKGEAARAARGLSGPVAIFVMLWMFLRTGIIPALAFLRFLCVNLAIINLLPLPVLDGGHIVFALYEMITRRPPPPRLINALVNIFALLLILLMVFLIGRDTFTVSKLFR